MIHLQNLLSLLNEHSTDTNLESIVMNEWNACIISLTWLEPFLSCFSSWYGSITATAMHVRWVVIRCTTLESLSLPKTLMSTLTPTKLLSWQPTWWDWSPHLSYLPLDSVIKTSVCVVVVGVVVGAICMHFVDLLRSTDAGKLFHRICCFDVLGFCFLREGGVGGIPDWILTQPRLSTVLYHAVWWG